MFFLVILTFFVIFIKKLYYADNKVKNKKNFIKRV